LEESKFDGDDANVTESLLSALVEGGNQAQLPKVTAHNPFEFDEAQEE